MLHLITRIDPTDEFDKTCFGIMNVTQGLINRLKEYREITDRTPKADHVVFDEDCFFFAGDDFLCEYIDSLLPDIKAKAEDLNEGDFFATTEYLIARQHVEASIELAPVTCESVRMATVPRGSAPTFFAYNEYSSVEYWFRVSIEYLENALKYTEPISHVLTADQKEKYLQSPGRCPTCQSTNINGVGHCQTDGSGAWQEITCRDCGFSWQDIYSLTGVMEMHS